jgi:predicted dehydrogenase
VEKPLALTLEELREVWTALKENPACRLIVGFNRPFSPSAVWLFAKLGALTPRMMHYRVNAGFIPADSWVHDPKSGGGRLLGEGCHFFDFLRHAAGARAESVLTETPADGESGLQATGNFAATIRFSNHSVGQVLYSSQGAPGMHKEHFECFTGQRCGAIDDYRAADFYHADRRDQLARHAQDKGQGALLDAFIGSLRGNGPPPVVPEDLLESSLLTLAAQQSLLSRQPVHLAELRKLIL